MLGALSRDHTKKKNSIKSQKTQNAGTWNWEFIVTAKP
jgi:hypothetical protein